MSEAKDYKDSFHREPFRVPVLTSATVMQMPPLFRDMAYLLEEYGEIIIE